MNAANRLAHFVVGGGRDRAGVEHHEVGLAGGAGGVQSFGGQTRLDGSAIGLRGAAAEILNKVVQVSV
jgi:hypothetical protein